MSLAGLIGQTDSATPFETSLGFEAGASATGLYGTYIGYQAGKAVTTGGYSTVLGYRALATATAPTTTIAIGRLAAQDATAINDCIAIGDAAMRYGGTYSTAIGHNSMSGNVTSGANTTAVGASTLVSTTGAGNTAVGASAGSGVTSGANNVLLGYSAGAVGTTLTTGSNNIIIGYQAAPSSATVSNEVTLGNSSITKTRLFGQVDLLGSNVGTVTAVAASDIDCSAGNYFTKTATGALTWTVTNVPSSRAYSFLLELTNGGTGTQTWFSGTKWPGGTAPTLTTSGVDMLGFITDDGGTTWRGVQLMKDSK